MNWLWFAGPLTALVVYFCISLWPSAEEKRMLREVGRWLDEFLGPLPVGKKTRSRRVRRLPAGFDGLIEDAGGGARVTDAVLVPKLAYLSVRAADGFTTSNQVTVVCKLAKAAPELSCSPLPALDGKPMDNRGISFSKDPEFTDAFFVDGANAKDIRKWLKPALREALVELPEVFLRVKGTLMALTLYGAVDADKLDELVGVADAIFAERGAGGESLFGDAPLKVKSVAKGDREARPIVPGERPKKAKDKSADKGDVPAPVPTRIKAGAFDFALYAIGTFALAAVAGQFASWHPQVLFNSPDIVVTEPWQGGWTTKGIGAITAVETYLAVIFCWQAYLSATAGQSIGKRLFGAKVVRISDGTVPGFVRGVIIRRWLLGLPIVIAAGMMAVRPLRAASFLERIPSFVSVGLLLAGIAVGVATLVGHARKRGIHDRIAGTWVKQVAPWRIPAIQLGAGERGLDPAMFARLSRVGGLIAGFIVLNTLMVMLLHTDWLFEWPFHRVDKLLDMFRK
jgi:hypothetical protein